MPHSKHAVLRGMITRACPRKPIPQRVRERNEESEKKGIEKSERENGEEKKCNKKKKERNLTENNYSFFLFFSPLLFT